MIFLIIIPPAPLYFSADTMTSIEGAITVVSKPDDCEKQVVVRFPSLHCEQTYCLKQHYVVHNICKKYFSFTWQRLKNENVSVCMRACVRVWLSLHASFRPECRRSGLHGQEECANNSAAALLMIRCSL